MTNPRAATAVLAATPPRHPAMVAMVAKARRTLLTPPAVPVVTAAPALPRAPAPAAPAAATVTPFGRFAVSSVTQNAFSEWGADSLSLNVQQQTTNSLRTTLGAEFGSALELGGERSLDLALRLGWQHEFAYTGRPITAAFAGAPGNSFTVYGATPQPDSAVIGFQASTTVADATRLYLRYDGEIGNGTDNHALNLGLRRSW
jgi:outer membrane autotransporter protein